MMVIAGLRAETRYEWEKRTPIVPEDMKKLIDEGIEFIVQPSQKRVFADDEYAAIGAKLDDDLSPASVIFGLKEVPPDEILEGKTYIIFSHTIKGQKHNMPMLKRFMELGCNLIDYEKITDENGRRLIFFGRHAGLAGMMDTLWALGRRLDVEGIKTPFDEVKRAYEYHNVEEAKEHLRQIGERIKNDGLPEELTPFIVGFAGYGNVSRGAQEILDVMDPVEIEPEDLERIMSDGENNRIYKVVFKEKHTVVRRSDGGFDLQEFFSHPELYRSVFDRYLPYLSVLINAIYWTPKSPRLVTKEGIKKLWERGQKRLKVIGDISCDIEGGIEITVKATEPPNPVYVYEPLTGRVRDGFEGDGPVVLAIDILPSEIPRDASEHFSHTLMQWAADIARANYAGELEDSGLPPEIKRAVILWHGNLTEPYKYIEKFLD